MSRRLLIGQAIFFTVILVAALFLILPRAGRDTGVGCPQTMRSIVLAKTHVCVEVVADEASREKGLGGRNSLSENEGMLFVFPESGVHKFWMKDMRISIDMVWLDEKRTVVFISGSVAPATYPATFGPEVATRYTLELPSGWAASHLLSVGDVAQL